MNDTQKMQPFLNQIVKIAKFGIGYENNSTASIVGLDINAWVKPYVHSNSQEIITNLATAVQNGFLSKQTASERCPEFPKNAEWERILREKKEEDQQDLLIELEKQDNETENAIEEAKQTANIQNGGKGNVRTGRGAGRPNKSGREYDSSRNWDGRVNWDKGVK